MEPSRYAELFLSESRAHISSINHALLELERTGDVAVVEELFRSAHTLKGMSSAMGCQGAADLAHASEHLLDRLRQGELPLDGPALEALFEAADVLETVIPLELAGEPLPGSVAPLLARLRLLAGDEAPPAGAHDDAPGAGGPPAGTEEEGLLVTVMIQAAAALPAVRALLVLRTAREMGEVRGVEPQEEQLLAGAFAGTLRFRLRTERSPDAVRESLLGAGDVAHVLVEEPGRTSRAAAADGGLAPPDAERSSRSVDAYVRIHQGRLDTLVERVGELVVARDRLREILGERPGGELGDTAEHISRLVGELRDEVMGMRMVPIGDAFDRFPRFVRDAARAMGKRVRLEVEGRDTPLDRSLHNDLSDLLIHLIRNALDHGIEGPEERVAAGKEEEGLLRLSAARERASVVVRVSDDGAGVDRERVLAVAVERGMVAERQARAMGDQEVMQLLTRPGFSTVREVTEVSGRGVGLDVVATRMRALGGRLEIVSSPGEGTTFVLTLPLSLAIVSTLLVEAAGETYVVPISGIEEVTELGTGRNGRPDRFEFREERLPLLRLGEVFDGVGRAHDDERAPVLVARGPEGLFAVGVERLRGQHEAVLKPFDAPGRMTHVFAGATILSDGRPALVLDPMKLGRWAVSAQEPARAEGAPDGP